MNKLLIFIFLTGFFNLNAQNKNVITINEDITLIPLEDSIYIHTSYYTSKEFGRFSSNGMIIVKRGEAIMIDTPMDDEQTKTICEYLKDSMNITVTHLIIGHYHADCLGGINYLHSKGIKSIANVKTLFKCKELGLPLPMRSFIDSLAFDFNGKKVVCKYFGGGHTIDNIVVWLPNEKILFGGCLVKASNSTNLGNLADAVVGDWKQTIEKIQDTYPDIKYIVPGHGNYGGKECLSHTIELVENYTNN